MTNLDDLDINIITNMASGTGIGSYALEVYRVLHKDFPKVKLISVPYIKGRELNNSMNLSKFYANSFLQIPFANRMNFYLIKKSKQFEGKNIHLVGSDYSMMSVSDNVVTTIHEYYFTMANLFRSRNMRGFLSEVGYNCGELELRWEMKKFKKIIAPSHYTANQIKANFGINSEVVHETVDESRFHPRDRDKSRELLNLPKDKKLLLNVSGEGINKNLRVLKGISDILPDRFKLLKIGAPINSKNAVNIHHAADEYYPLYFNAADMYLNVSTNEGFNIPLLESLKSSLPVVSNKCATSVELLGGSAFYVDNPSDKGKYIELVKFANDREVLKHNSELTSKRASEFSDDKAKREFVKIYSEVFK